MILFGRILVWTPIFILEPLPLKRRFQAGTGSGLQVHLSSLPGKEDQHLVVPGGRDVPI